jgi:cytochrome d ubiquinol oxidase subunit II
MPTLWFILVALMLTTYVALDGFDLGAGIIHLTVAHNDQERRLILRAIGPVWDGNEVWLIAAGGTLFFTFPLLYAASFSGFYLPLIIVLWLLMLRGVAVELRSRLNSPLWWAFWDGTFFLGSALLSLFYGAALGNVVRGVPLNVQENFFEALWTDFNPFSQNPGILDWYTILVGLMAFATLTLHGANYIAVKTTGPVNERAHRIATRAWAATVILAILVTIATYFVQPQIQLSFFARPWQVIFPLLAAAGLIGTLYFGRTKKELMAFYSSIAFIVGMLASVAAGLYPVVLPATDPGFSLTISNASGSQYGQTVGLVWWIIGMILAVLYFTLTYRLFWGKITVSAGEESHY